MENYYYKNFYSSNKLSLVFIGNSSKLILNNYNLNSKKKFLEFIFFEENDSKICEAGLNYNQSAESYLTKVKKKPKKAGFFESFFNLFSK